jgi:hypothetical protein
MATKYLRLRLWLTTAAVGVLGVVGILAWTAENAVLSAAPINPEVYKRQFEDARKSADVVAQVRVLAAVCTDVTEEGGNRTATLELSLQVLGVDKGPVKKNDLLVVTHKVSPPAGPGPRAYGYMAAVRQFPFTPGVKGDVALRWDKDHRTYVSVAGWVAEPNDAVIPTEVGKAFVAGDTPAEK